MFKEWGSSTTAGKREIVFIERNPSGTEIGDVAHSNGYQILDLMQNDNVFYMVALHGTGVEITVIELTAEYFKEQVETGANEAER